MVWAKLDFFIGGLPNESCLHLVLSRDVLIDHLVVNLRRVIKERGVGSDPCAAVGPLNMLCNGPLKVDLFLVRDGSIGEMHG